MKNRELEVAWDYHNQTKHSFSSIRTNPHSLDWDNQPLPFKIYSTLTPVPIPQDLPSSGMPALTAISAAGLKQDGQPIINKQILAEIFHFSAGITKRRTYPGGETLFRAAACTGALYHIDLYLICGELSDLEGGGLSFRSPRLYLEKAPLRGLPVCCHRCQWSRARRGQCPGDVSLCLNLLAQLVEIPSSSLPALLLG